MPRNGSTAAQVTPLPTVICDGNGDVFRIFSPGSAYPLQRVEHELLHLDDLIDAEPIDGAYERIEWSGALAISFSECPHCGGDGHLDLDGPAWRGIPGAFGLMPAAQWRYCPDCAGTGFRWDYGDPVEAPGDVLVERDNKGAIVHHFAAMCGERGVVAGRWYALLGGKLVDVTDGEE